MIPASKRLKVNPLAWRNRPRRTKSRRRARAACAYSVLCAGSKQASANVANWPSCERRVERPKPKTTLNVPRRRLMTETKKTVPRRDGAGHLNPEYEKKLMDDLRENHPPKDDDRAFLPRARSAEEVSEELGENFVASA